MSTTLPPRTQNQTSSARRTPRSVFPWLVLVAVTCTILAFGRFFPSIPGLTLIIESLLPWSILPLLAFTALSLGTRRPSIIALTLIPLLVWTCIFGPRLLGVVSSQTNAALSSASADLGSGAGGQRLRIVTNNVEGAKNDPIRTTRAITSAKADIVTLQELEADPGRRLRSAMDDIYEYSAQIEGLGVWSTRPVSEAREVSLDSRFVRAFRTTLRVDDSTIAYYVVHVPSIRPGMEEGRNRALQILAETIRAENSEKIIVSGDFNTASTDRNFAPLAELLTDTAEVNPGLDFTWPSVFPLMRLDRIMISGLTARSEKVIDTGGSDHRMVLAEVSLGTR